MGLIKATNVPSAATTFSMRDIEAHAQALLLRAQQQADQILAAAQTQGNKIRQDAYDKGFSSGLEDGTKKGINDGRAAGTQAALQEYRGKLETLAKTLTNTVSEIDVSRGRIESDGSLSVLRLAIAIARRATKQLGAFDSVVVTDNVREAMKLVVHSVDVRIAVHPSQKAMLDEVLPKLRLKWPGVKHVELMEDAELEPGGCRILTAQGVIDADLETQLQQIASELVPAQTAAEKSLETQS
jgi:flagellar assembly protein FliH